MQNLSPNNNFVIKLILVQNICQPSGEIYHKPYECKVILFEFLQDFTGALTIFSTKNCFVNYTCLVTAFTVCQEGTICSKFTNKKQ